MYLKRPKEVTNAQRPSSAKYFTQVIFCSFDVNGAATDASAYKNKFKSNVILFYHWSQL